MSKSRLIISNFSIVLLLTNLSSMGMNTKHPYDLARIDQKFTEGIFQYDRGSKALAEIMLFEAYSDAKRKNLLPLIDQTRLIRVRSMICVTQCKRGFYQTALSFADDLIDQQKIYQFWTKDAYKKGDFAQGQKYLESALKIKKQIAEHKTVEPSQPTIKHENNIALSLQLDPSNIETPCILSGIYLSDNQVPRCYSTAFKYAQESVKQLIKMPIDTAMPIKYTTSLPITIKRLCCEPEDQNIKNNATILQNYYTALSAIKMKNVERLKELASLHKTNNTIEAIPLQLLCSSIDPLRLCALTQNLTFYSLEFIAFCASSECELALSALGWALCNLTLSQQQKDLYHIFLGNYEYHKNNFDDAITHFKQCSHYDKNLYLQTLSLKASNPSTHREKMISLLPILENSLSNSEQKNEQTKLAQTIIAQMCGYNPTAPTQEILKRCQNIISTIALSSKDKYPFEWGYIALALNDMNKRRSTLFPDQQEKMNVLTSYFTFLSALQSSNQKELDRFFSAKDNNLNKIRHIVLRSLRGTNKIEIQKIIFETKSFQQFCLSDEFIIKPILMHILNHPDTLCKIKPEYCHYILGGIALIENNDDLARHHLLQCNKNDLYILAQIIAKTNYNDILSPLREYLSLKTKQRTNNNHLNPKDAAAKQLIDDIFCSGKLIQAYTDHALENHHYENAYDCIECLMQLAIPETYSSIYNCFIKIEEGIMQLPAQEYHALLKTSCRLNTYETLQECTAKKNHPSHFCNCLAYILHKRSEHESYTHEDRLVLQRGCLHYLTCSLNHEIRDHDTHRDKLILCANLAHDIGITDNSIELLDLSIKYGNPRALRTKADMLARKDSANVIDEIADILKQHINSDDEPDQKALSYNELGHYHFAKQDLKNQKIAFDYFKAAAELGNYQAGHILANFYIYGIRGYQAPDKQKALLCLEKTIDFNQKDSYGEALYLHASLCYDENQYKQAEIDLEKIIALTHYHDAQKVFSYWLMGLVKLQLSDEQSDLSEATVSPLYHAYDIINRQKLLDSTTSLMKNLILIHDKKTIDILEKKISHILEHKKIDDLSLCFCATIGAILFEQCDTKPITDRDRKCAISALLHAAKNKNSSAAFSLLAVSADEVNPSNKIYYLEILPKDNPDLTNIIQSTLKDIYPEEVLGQSTLIQLFAEKNNDMLLKKYIAHMYDNRMPIAYDTTDYKLYSQECTNNLIQKCLQINILTQSAEAFLKNPMKSIPLEQFAAIFLGSLLAYSTDNKELIKGARLLETSRKHFPTIQIEHIEKNLGNIYYKLAHHASENDNKILTLGYLKKGIELKNDRCLNTLTLCVGENEKKIKIIEDRTKATVKCVSELETFKRELDLKHKHPTYHLLVSSPTDQFSGNDILRSINIINQKHSRADISKCDDPELCLQYAIAMYKSDENSNFDQIIQLIQKSITLGTIKDISHKNALFNRDLMLMHACELITTIITKNNTKHMNNLLPKIKHILSAQGIDIKAFESFYQTFHKINLARNAIWRKAK